MTHRFSFTVTPDETELCLSGPDGPLPVDRWPAEAPASLRPGVDLAQRLEAADSATPVDTTLFIKHSAVAGLTAHEAALLGLPPAADAVAVIATKGIVTQPNYEVTLRWQRPTGQAIAGAKRTGAWLEIGGQWHRLPDPLFSLAEAVDGAQQAGDDVGRAPDRDRASSGAVARSRPRGAGDRYARRHHRTCRRRILARSRRRRR